jgi:hypothetical protein
MDVVTGLLFGLVVALFGFCALHAYAAWSIRNIDRDLQRARGERTTIDETTPG